MFMCVRMHLCPLYMFTKISHHSPMFGLGALHQVVLSVVRKNIHYRNSLSLGQFSLYHQKLESGERNRLMELRLAQDHTVDKCHSTTQIQGFWLHILCPCFFCLFLHHAVTYVGLKSLTLPSFLWHF